ncbi:hypothetical protein [Marinibactrum halimedae]|uniref:Pteridine-dependent deoxygenase like protein n=1 Tax=Marinibactrum halimedae TaxID=1444977 RepID=A0AA37T7X0_9GAMM|nr:hypothetical protein [Marinibactrum halimedae]MCD9460433.1 hypothetical protein [Marinibactrum halimedae]GLS27436.1 pteridine-dependent deoxygenase like protein [Marinibactrum halimedae]
MSLRCEYRQESVAEVLRSDRVLGVVSFLPGQYCGDDPRVASTSLIRIDDEYCCEAWLSDTPVEYGVDESTGLGWSCNEEILWVSVKMSETPGTDMTELSYQAYSRLLDFISSRGYPNVVRAWNYFKDINKGEGDEERYKQFCLGRHNALIEHEYLDRYFPAASALGCHEGELIVYMIASKEKSVQVENARQVSAYHYPRQYGLRAPSFARAAYKSWARSADMYISGTASIVGYESQHQGDVLAQLALTLENISALVDQVNEIDPMEKIDARFGLDLLKVYIRHQADYPLIRKKLEEQYGHIPALYLQADVCRQELDVEIEGVGSIHL